jgi:RNA polymerase sigma-70 factor (ECF subfamily)
MTDPAEFEAFMRNYQNMVFTSAVRLLGNHAEAQDIAQEVFLKAYDRFAQLRQSPTLGGWLKTVTRNLCLNHLTRYRKRWRVFSDMQREDPRQDSSLFEARLAAPDLREADERTANQREILERALASLPSDQRVALVLYHFEEMPYQEIADRLQHTLSKVKTDISRGRETLRRRLESRREELEMNP